MRIGAFVVAMVAILAIASANAADKPRITTFTISPAEPLSPNPRARVETVPLNVPPPPPSMVVATVPLTPEQMLGRWTERDARFCQEEQYVVEWGADRLRLVLDGREIDGGAVRYVADGATVRIERLSETGEVAAYWRLIGVDDDHVEWVETAERRGAVLQVIAKPDKLFVRCAPDAERAPGFAKRLQRWWAGVLGRLWPAS